jgi:polyhydroxyalkanoate synthesis regulator phasin
MTTETPKRPMAEMLEKAWEQAEKSIEDTVKKSLAKLKLPRREELAQLNARLDALAKRLEALDK